MKFNPKSTQHKQRGLAVLEMVIVLPILMMLLFVTAEFGRLFNNYNELSKAVRNGGRYVSEHARRPVIGVTELTDAEILNTKNLVVFSNRVGSGNPILPNLIIDDVTVVLTPLGTAPNDTSNVSVQASWVYQTMLGTTIPTFDFGPNGGFDISNLTLDVAITMRVIN